MKNTIAVLALSSFLAFTVKKEKQKKRRQKKQKINLQKNWW
jgi:hypothetical protein